MLHAPYHNEVQNQRIFNVTFSNDMGHAVFSNTKDYYVKLPQVVSDYCYHVLRPRYIVQKVTKDGFVFYHLKSGLNTKWTYYMGTNTIINMTWEC